MLYAGNSMGVGTGKCATYRMAMEVAVDGSTVKGRIKQQGRPDRDFQATMGTGGAIKTTAVVKKLVRPAPAPVEIATRLNGRPKGGSTRRGTPLPAEGAGVVN